MLNAKDRIRIADIVHPGIARELLVEPDRFSDAEVDDWVRRWATSATEFQQAAVDGIAVELRKMIEPKMVAYQPWAPFDRDGLMMIAAGTPGLLSRAFLRWKFGPVQSFEI